MTTVLKRIAAGEVMLADGAMGTMLMKHGLKPGACPELMNADRPDVLTDIARQYCQAGSDIVLTNTFGASPLKLAQYGIDDRTEELNIAAVKAARQACSDTTLVAASIGPSGQILKPYGEAEPGAVLESFARQIAAVQSAGIDMIFVETMIDLSEAVLAIRAARQEAPEIPISATMTFDETPTGFFTVMGVSVEEAADGLIEAGADVVGSNCGNGIEKMVEIARQFRSHSKSPVIIQSNAGLPRSEGGGLFYDESPDFMANHVRTLIDIGVNVIGGCCGTTPDYIRVFRDLIDGRN
ncbi:MAG: homocysteine S-methyltransferase family protein [candidate division Zixibacteria bacterium]